MPSMMSEPSQWVARFAPLIRSGEVLDLACGSGRHSRLLASLGYQVMAVDRDAGMLDTLASPKIETLCCDLENGQNDGWPFAKNRFAGIVVTNYLHRPLFPALLDSLAPGGMLIYETFAVGNEKFGKPGNPDFLLQDGELLPIAQSANPYPLHVVAYENGYVELPKAALIQRICAIKLVDASTLASLPFQHRRIST